MNSQEIRQKFLNFFSEKQHVIIPSAPMVIKDDPTLMFTNAGMNQFKDIFLGIAPGKYPRIANTQKCLRVSGKHNDLEEVGHDTYHHTMFEMLGNWSFGNPANPAGGYFKKEAIEWAWELLTEIYHLNRSDLYITVFGGDMGDDLPWDEEAYNYWKRLLPDEQILRGSKKDNFWEMGDTGPCGPCSEIHIDIRPDSEKALTRGQMLVNKGHPLVIEIWNLVFIQYNRLANGKLLPLPAKHVDTGMGFERLCMALQNVKSNYDTDVFQPIIKKIEELTGIKYNTHSKSDVAMRVISDHLRAVAFAIADGQLPSNNKAGYVIRRILRRAVRYAYSHLEQKEPFIFKLLPVLVDQMKDIFPELRMQQNMISKVMHEEEASFLRTLMHGIHKFNQHLSEHKSGNIIEGTFAFELYDTFGFPIDLTQLMAREQGWSIDMEAFGQELEKQKQRSRQDANVDTGDWKIFSESTDTQFIGWDTTTAETRLLRYRRVKSKGKDLFHIVLDKTPFYPESGGQVGDTGELVQNGVGYKVIDTRKENNLIIHLLETFPLNPDLEFFASVDSEKRYMTANNHTATHLLHQGLRKILGIHVEQKGSFVGPDYLRFDFSHFSKMSPEELNQTETFVNEQIRKNLLLDEHRNLPIEEAKNRGAIMFFGEKYGDNVRTVGFGNSLELCGGTHVDATGRLGLFRIVSEGAIAAGIRRIEAVTASKADEFINNKIQTLQSMTELINNPSDPLKALSNILAQLNDLQKQVEGLNTMLARTEKVTLLNLAQNLGGIRLATAHTMLHNQAIKDLAFDLRSTQHNLVVALAGIKDGKVNLSLIISDDLVKQKKLNAGVLIRELATEIDGGGGGQPFFATAGGKNPGGIEKAFDKLKSIIDKVSPATS